MADYSEQTARAAAKIAAKGVVCLWFSAIGAGDTNPSPPPVNLDPVNPWFPEQSYEAEPAGVEVSIVFLPSEQSNKRANMFDATIRQPNGWVYAMMAGSAPVTPKYGDWIVTPDGRKLMLRMFDPVAPNLAPIIWNLEFAT